MWPWLMQPPSRSRWRPLKVRHRPPLIFIANVNSLYKYRSNEPEGPSSIQHLIT
jgi:hypothetical protein